MRSLPKPVPKERSWSIADRSSRENQLLRAGLAVAAALVSLVGLGRLLVHHEPGVDLEIPLDAASRWVAGLEPYRLDGFAEVSGPGLPFLYPPYVLPLLAPLLLPPRELVIAGWVLTCAVAAFLASRRLGLPASMAVLLLAWPPYAEAVIGGNVQVIAFAAFAALLWTDGKNLDPRSSRRPAKHEAALAAAVSLVKVTQVHAGAYLLARRPRAGMLAIVPALGIGILTLPLVGPALWGSWIDVAPRAGDPSWIPAGIPLATLVGREVALTISIASVAAAFVVRPGPLAGAWLGLLAVIGAPSLHMFGLLFLLPGILAVRREIGLLAAGLVATYMAPLMWAGIILVGASLSAAGRWPSFLEATEIQGAGKR